MLILEEEELEKLDESLSMCINCKEIEYIRAEFNMCNSGGNHIRIHT